MRKMDKIKALKAEIEKTVEKFVCRTQSIFTLKDVKKSLSLPSQQAKFIESAIEEVLKSNPCIFYNETFRDCRMRADYFYKANFLLIPDEEEMEKGILIPGHRFIPFSGIDVLPFQCKLQLPDGSAIPMKIVHERLEEMIPYHNLLGREEIIGYTLLNDSSNERAFKREDPTKNIMAFRVFDMKNIYALYDFKQGDAFVATVLNWKKGIYSIEYFPSRHLKNIPNTQPELTISWKMPSMPYSSVLKKR